MKRCIGIARLLAVVFAVVGLFALSVGPAAAEHGADNAIVTIHKATCPTGTTGNIFDACHANALADVSFDIQGFEIGATTITTDDDGVASATILEAAETEGVTVIEDPDVFADYLGAYVYCSEQNSGTVLFDGSDDDGVVSFTASQGDDIICDWYNITEADDGAAPTPTATATGGGTTLPDTGSGQQPGERPSWPLLLGALGLALAAGAVGLRRRTA